MTPPIPCPRQAADDDDVEGEHLCYCPAHREQRLVGRRAERDQTRTAAAVAVAILIERDLEEL